MKKFLSSILALALVLSVFVGFAVTANAAEGNAAKIGDTEYGTLAEAVADAEIGDVITLLTDVNLTTEVRVEKSVTIDLGGHTLTSNGVRAIHAYRAGSVVTVQNGTVSSNYSGTLSASYNGKLILGENLTVKSTGNYGVYINRGELEVSAASVYVEGKARAIGIKDHIENKLVIKGGVYSHAVSSEFVPAGYVGVWNADTKYEIVAAVKVDNGGNVKYYTTLKDAVEAADDGAVITLMDDLVLTDDDIVMAGSYKVMANVTAKDVTLDLNGKTIDVEYNGGAYLIAVIRVADGAELTVTGDGNINVENNAINVAYMFWKQGTTGSLVIENGTYHMADSGDSMVYTNGSEIVTVKGGTFILDAVGTRSNGFPCIFNAQGQNERNIIVEGGTFNDDILHQYYPFEVQLDKTLALSKNDGIYTVVPAMAYVSEIEGIYTNEVGYTSFAAAFEAAGDGEKITLLGTDYLYADELVDFDGEYLTFFEVNNKTLTVDLNGFKLQGITKGAEKMVVGMFATNDNGHLILEDSSEAKTGTVQISSQGSTLYALIVNYEPGCTITVNGGNYTTNKAYDCLLYTGANEGLIVNDGTFNLGNLGQGPRGNGSPWMFNALGQNERHVIVNGGSFCADIQHQYYPFEVLVPKELALKNENGMYTIVPAVAWVNEQEWSSAWYTNEIGYATLDEAIAACEDVKTKIVGKKTYTSAQEKVTILVTAEANDAEALVDALETGKNVVLTQNVDINPAGMSNAYGTTGINVKYGQTVDGGGNVLDIQGAGGTWDSGINTTGGTIKNITVTGSFRGIFINHNSTYSDKVVLENVIIDGTVYTISCDQGNGKGLLATNCTFNGWTSYAATLGNAKFVNCEFGEGNGYAYCRPYAPTEFVGCDFEAGFELDARAAVTFENCYLDGVLITAENLATLVTSNIANASVK